MYKKIALVLACSLVANVAFAENGKQKDKTEEPPAWEFTTVDFPGFATFSYVISMNKHGDVAGYFDDANGAIHGYVLPKGGSYTQIDVPGAISTALATIADNGDMSGTYVDASGFQHGFFWDDDGVTTIDFPGAVQTTQFPFELGPGLGTAAAGLNKHGDIVGEYADSSNVAHGFLLHDGQFVSFDALGDSSVPGSETLATAINSHGDIVGGHHTGPGPALASRGFLRHDGQMSIIQVPEAVDTFGTIATGINNHGDVVGSYSGPTFSFFDFHGFLLSKGQYHRIDVPGALITETFTVTNKGDVVGAYGAPDFRLHGYIGVRKN